MLFGYVTWLLITNWQNKNSNIFILKDDITYYLILLPVGGYTQLTKTGKITIIHFYPIFYKTSNYYFYLAIKLVIMLLRYLYYDYEIYHISNKFQFFFLKWQCTNLHFRQIPTKNIEKNIFYFSNLRWNYQKNNPFFSFLWCCCFINNHEMRFIIFVVKEDGLQRSAIASNPSKSRRNLHDKMEKRDSYQNYCLKDFLWCLILIDLELDTTSFQYLCASK